MECGKEDNDISRCDVLPRIIQLYIYKLQQKLPVTQCHEKITMDKF